MGDQRSRINRENIRASPPVIATNPELRRETSSKESHTRWPTTPCTWQKAPVVNKVDGRARILRPLRQLGMHSNQQQQPTSSSSGAAGGRSSSSMPHSQSMPVLQSGSSAPRAGGPQSQQQSSRVSLTLPSNTSEKNTYPLLTWAELIRTRIEKLRQASRKAANEVLNEQSTMADLKQSRDLLTEMSNIFAELNRAATMKCRLNTVFDKRDLYKNVELAIQNMKIKDPRVDGLYDKMQQAMEDRTVMEKNVVSVCETFRQNPLFPIRRSRLAPPPPVTFSKHVEESHKGIFRAMDSVMGKTKGDPMLWKFKRISHPYFRNSKFLMEVKYCARRPSGEKEFVSHMKAMIVLKYGVLEDLVIGGEDEDLYDQERLLDSKRLVYREFTKSAKDIILCSPVTKFTNAINIAQCNNYIQMYVSCFSNKCHYCKKHLRKFLPPTVVTRESPAIYCHRLCLMSQVPPSQF